MASGNRSGYGNWELDKGEINLDYCDVGLGLKLPWQQEQQQQQQQHHQQQQQQQQSSFSSGRDSITAVPWLQTRQNRQENRSSSPTISGFHQISRFGDGGRLTFTAGQRQELERQTIIYKYMMASMPVPPELLIPLSKYPSSTITTSSSTSSEVVRKTGVEMRYVTGRGGDPEPWRCRRTDGKKWRCSRDVAPDQKYCERHSHKGRPSRSRKPVESSSSPSPSILSPPLPLTTTTTTNTTTPSVTTSNPIVFTPFAIPKPSSSSFDLPSPSHFNSLPRYPDWFMKKDVAPPNATTAPACLYTQQIGETRASAVDDHQSCLLSRPFIDAWSLGDHVDPKDATNTIDNDNNSITTNKCPTPSSPLNSILPLTLSMSAGFDHDHDHHTSEDNTKDHIERSSLSSASHHHHHHHHQPFNWMNSWISSPPGGPLAEALCLGISGAGNGRMGSHSDDQLVSPHGHSTSSSTTTLG